MSYKGTAFTNHNPECMRMFFPLSKQPLIDKSIDLPKGNDVNAILAANAVVTIVIIGHNQADSLTQEIRH